MLPEAAAYKKEWQLTQSFLRGFGEDCAFVYVHLQEDTGEPFYVGIGVAETRPWALSGRTQHHKNVASKHGIRVEIIADGLSWDAACFWEQRWIKALRGEGYRLVNLTDGGDGTLGFYPSEKIKEKMRGPRPALSQQKKELGAWLGDKNPNKKCENKHKISIRMKTKNPLFRPEIVALRSGENHHSKKEGYVHPCLGKSNEIARQRMITSNPMLDPKVARKANDARKANGNGWEGSKNPSLLMSKQQLLERGKKSAETRRRNKLLREGVE